MAKILKIPGINTDFSHSPEPTWYGTCSPGGARRNEKHGAFRRFPSRSSLCGAGRQNLRITWVYKRNGI